MTRQTLLSILPPPAWEKLVIVKTQTVDDIVPEILAAHEEFAPDYDLICEEFAAGDTLRRLYDFCKTNLRNDTEGKKLQTTTSPAVLLEKGYCDCKGYAGFIGGILDALNRAGLGKYNWCYRFAEYKEGDQVHYHVFIVVKGKEGKEVWVDPVLSSFDTRTPYPDQYFDKKKSAMTLMRISGVGCQVIPGSAVSGSCRPLAGYGSQVGGIASSYYYTLGGQVFANDTTVRANGLTADQMGLPYAMLLLNKGNPGYDGRHPGTAAQWWKNPPVTFWLNNQPYALPSPNVTPGGQVPLMPLGLEIRYAPSFLNFNIPPAFMRPVVAPGPGPGYQNKLRMSPDLYPIDTQLSSLDSLPLIVLEAAVGPLINSFSAYPYANNFGSTNNIDDKMFNHRNADDLLQPSISHTVLQTVAPVAEVLAQGLNFIAPGLGVLAAGGIKAAAGSSQASAGPEIVNPATEPGGSLATGTGILAPGTPAGAALSWIQSNPLLAFAIVALLGVGIYELTD